MENVVNAIIEIDRQATDKLDKANKKRDVMLQQAKADAQKLADDMNKKALEQIKKVEKFHIDIFNEDVLVLNEKCGVEMKMLDDFYQKNHTAIEESIFNRIVGE